jgi:TRAP-type transport system periplasmic protein
MKNKRGVRYVFVICAAMISLLVLFSAADAADRRPIELKFAYPYSNVSAVGRSMEYFANLVNQRSKGRVKITTYPSGTLIQSERIYEAVVAGLVDIGNWSPHWVATKFPSNDATMLPLPVKDGWTVSHVVNDWYWHFKPKDYDDVHTFFVASCGPFALQMRDKPVAKPQDLKGVKVRAAGSQAAAFAKALGAVPVGMPMSEVYEAISRGMVDGQFGPMESLKGWKHAEVVKYVTRLPISWIAPNNTFMNMKKWNALPPDIKKIFDDAVPEALEAEAKAWWYGDFVGEDFFAGLGGGRQIIEIPTAEIAEWESPVSSIRATFIAEKKNIPATEYIKYIEERLKYWTGRLPDKKATQSWVEKELLQSK